MQSLEHYFSEKKQRDIHTLGRYIAQHVNENWESVFLALRERMIARYAEIGDSVYGLYGDRLFKPVHAQFKEVGLRAMPRLPGKFDISREWGDDDSDRQRWMWSKIITTEGEAVGTIVTVFFHDHLQIRIPRPFDIIALSETSKTAVVSALSARSEDFKNALEAQIEYAAYYQQASSDTTP